MRRFLLLALIAFPAFAQHYEGTLTLPRGPLSISFDFEGTKATITIPAQNVKAWELAKVVFDAATFSADMPNAPGNAHFEGKRDGDKIAGTLSQNGGIFPFSVEKKNIADAMSGFDDFATHALKSWDVPGAAVAAVSHGKVVYAKGLGSRDVKNNLPVSADTLFPIGSCTKAFTTFVLGQLADEGKLDWDKPVSRYLPGFRLADPTASQELTPRDLVTHRSGLPRHDLLWVNNQDLSRRELVERLQYLPASAELRAKYQYNNLMFMTAGYLIEQLTGKTWEEAVRTRVFAPLGMSRSTFSDADAQKSGDYAKPYRLDDDKVIEIHFLEVGNMGPAGSISSSANDIAKWLLVQLGDAHTDLIQASTLRELHTPQMAIAALPPEPELGPASYAMGWVVDTYRGHLRLSHGGAIDGFIASVMLFPNDDAAVAVFANLDGTGYPATMALQAADRVLALPAKDWNGERLARRAAQKASSKAAHAKKTATRKNGPASHPLADYAGDYENPGYGIVRIARDGETLKATYNGITTPLEHWHYDVWNGLKTADPTFEDKKFKFESDFDGNVASLVVPLEPSVAATVFAKKPDAKLSDAAFLKSFTGKYKLSADVVTVDLKGNRLVLNIPRQPSYELVPAIDGWFDLKGLTGFRAQFTPDTLLLSQPDGLYEAKRQ
ncbi:MAG TPA: serine hydrolase [Thermoanaerobaculia bacterium]|nr:serine hydrolase [Thermoanaerobaculia bacterium]